MELILTAIVCICILYLYFKPKPLKGTIIPGPKGLPFIGCANEVTAANIHHKLGDYALQYGDIVQFKLFGKNHVVFNSADYIRKAFCDDPFKQFLSDRSEYFVGKYIYYGNLPISSILNGFDPTHKNMRKVYTKGLHIYGEGVHEFETTVVYAVQDLLHSIENRQGEEFDFMQKINIAITKIVAILMSGETIDDDTSAFDDFITAINFLANPMVNEVLMALPFLRKVPGSYQNGYQAALNSREKLVGKYFHTIKETYLPGRIRGLVDYFIQDQKKAIDSGNDVLLTDERIMAMVSEMAVAGILTSWSTIGNMMLCLLHHPQYQTRMQQEIDNVIGRDRQPTIEDRKKCPFIEAVAMESQRYITTGPVSAPHYCKSNIAFEGFDIPKNTTIFANTHYVHHDEKVWGDPWTFRPERFLDEDGKLLPVCHEFRKNWLPFGIGRRQCVGESLARSRMFLVITSLLQRWNFVPSPDKCGSCDPRSDNFLHGIVQHSKPFFCHVEARC